MTLATPTAPITPITPNPLEFAQVVQRLTSMGATPIALVGAGSFVRKLAPTSFAPLGTLVGIIDEDPAKVGRQWAGLPVLDPAQALAKGIKGAIYTCYGPEFDRHWAKRGVLREAGVYLLTCPGAFATKGWDDCLIEQYEHSLALERGVKSVYTRKYPPEKPVAWEWLLKPLDERVRQGSTVLEIGSGTGLWTQHVIAKAGKYHAVDYAARLLFEAMEHRFARHMSKLHLHHDEQALLAGVPDQSVDVAFSYDVFVHLKPDLVHQYLESLKRVLKPDGRILLHFVTWNPRALEIWREKFHPGLRGQGDEMHYNPLDSLRTSADALGMKVEQLGPSVGWCYLAEFRNA